MQSHTSQKYLATAKRGGNSREGETANKDDISPLNHMLAYIRTHVCTYVYSFWSLTYIHRVVKNLCTGIQYIYNTNFSYT